MSNKEKLSIDSRTGIPEWDTSDIVNFANSEIYKDFLLFTDQIPREQRGFFSSIFCGPSNQSYFIGVFFGFLAGVSFSYGMYLKFMSGCAL